MNYAPIEDDLDSLAASKPRSTFRRHGHSTPRSTRVAERVALGMIARHGAGAAREAAIRLNRMIDCGDLAARDIWACVVHLIHQRQE